MVVFTALDHACSGGNVELIVADTDPLIMLTYFWNSLIGEITIKSEATKNNKAMERGIGNIIDCIADVRKYLTLVHTFSGFDIYGSIWTR